MSDEPREIQVFQVVTGNRPDLASQQWPGDVTMDARPSVQRVESDHPAGSNPSGNSLLGVDTGRDRGNLAPTTPEFVDSGTVEDLKQLPPIDETTELASNDEAEQQPPTELSDTTDPMV